MFTTNEAVDFSLVEEVITPKIMGEMNDSLTAIPNDAEIKKAVFSIHGDKAPGLDGFSAKFYYAYWNIIGDDVSHDIRLFFETSVLHQRQNDTHIWLTPKGSTSRKVADYRPIALCNTHYKIIAKILTKRLQSLLHLLISASQSAFFPDRQ